jgi:taurine dioxygenase
MITDYSFFRVRRLTPALGGEGTSLDFGIEVSDCFAAALREALWAHGVLVFHDLTITQEQQKTLARVFGDLHRHPVAGARGEDPYTSLVTADKNTVVVSGQDWHVDVSCEERPPIVSVLYLSEAPAIGCGGDTLFCSSIEIFRRLSPRLQDFLAALTATHDASRPYRHLSGGPPKREKFTSSQHPVVVKHPAKGVPVLYVNRLFTSAINELDPTESKALLEFLFDKVDRTYEAQCRIHSSACTLIIWDNFSVQHRAIWDYYPNRRLGTRVSAVGPKPVALID